LHRGEFQKGYVFKKAEDERARRDKTLSLSVFIAVRWNKKRYVLEKLREILRDRQDP
jgi:hypothetical protein